MVEGMAPPRADSLNFRSKFRDGKLGVLAMRDFRRFYVGYSVSLLGTAMSSVAMAFAVLGNDGTATDLGVVLAANIVPMIAFMLGGGAIVAWAAFGTLVVLAVPSVRHMTWLDTSPGDQQARSAEGE